jgi:4-hydroxythreonine-4-phosphate dehydrogenase
MTLTLNPDLAAFSSGGHDHFRGHRKAGLPPIAVTMGDPAGIGPEIVLKLLAPPLAESDSRADRTPSLDLATFVVYGDPIVLNREALRFGLDPAGLNVRSCSSLPADLPLGRVDARAGEAAFLAVRAAALDAMAGRVRAVVTAPLHKEALNAAGFHYPGHTEILAEIGGGVPVRMMLANDELRTVLVTIHQSLRSAIESLSQAAVLDTIVITHRHLEAVGIRAPRIAVAGLNPHAGEGGLMGREEIEVIAPAIATARARGIDATGPHAPDTVFMRARGFSTFDVVIAMYHDQGLIPVKYLGLEEGVNITIGLPFVRTSPDHGTAFDIAGAGRADTRSMAAAIRMADEMSAAALLDNQQGTDRP